jgi:hypothetical protein
MGAQRTGKFYDGNVNRVPSGGWGSRLPQFDRGPSLAVLGSYCGPHLVRIPHTGRCDEIQGRFE